MMHIIEQVKHNKLLMLISILIILLVVLLASKITYAYLDNPESNPGITEGKITASGDKLIFTKGNDLSLALSTDNFNYATKGNITTSTNPKVTLIANSKTKDAKAKYATGISITKNTFVSSDGKPELILQVKCDNEEIIKIDNLDYDETLKGFDITNKIGVFNAAVDKEITSQNSTEGVTHTWEYTIVLINKDIDQSINETAEFKAQVYIDDYMSLTNKILATYNGNGNKNLIYHDGKCDYEGEENCELEAGDFSYRFSGASDEVNNYVCLDEKETGTCTSDEDLYRIIGLFKNDQDEYEAKLIKAQGATAEELGDGKVDGGAYQGKYAYDKTYYKETNGETLAGYNWNGNNGISSTNMWQYSNLNKVNLNKFYYNYITTKATYLQNHITEHTWIIGGTNNLYDAKAVYDSELGDKKLKEGDEVCYTQANTTTVRKCTKEDIEYTAHIGLMYISDYMHGTISDNWLTIASNYSNPNVINNNWLYLGMYEWFISRNSSYGDVVRVMNSAGFVGSASVYSFEFGVRPCFYLSSDAKIKEGEGSKKIPYRITFD